MPECQKCSGKEKTKEYPYGFTGRSMILIGEFEADLCTKCVNEWHDFVMKTPEFIACQDSEIVLQGLEIQAKVGIDTSENYMSIKRAHFVIKEKLYQIAKAWVGNQP